MNGGTTSDLLAHHFSLVLNTVSDTCGPWNVSDKRMNGLKSGSLIPPASFFFLKIAMAFRGLLSFHTACKNFCSNSVKNAIGPLIGISVGSFCRVVDGPRVCHTEWSKSERKKWIACIKACMWNLEKWYWWTYLQSSNRHPDMENRHADTGVEGAGGTNREIRIDIYMLLGVE